MSKHWFPGCAVKSCMTVIERWSATVRNKERLFRVGTLSVSTLFACYLQNIIIAYYFL